MAGGSGIHVSVNGEAVQLPAGSTVLELLTRLALEPSRVAVEHNLRVVPRAEHATLRLNHGDRLEIVTFVGGGATGAWGAPSPGGPGKPLLPGVLKSTP
jgi:thiamine biosynthesis protein ThiS